MPKGYDFCGWATKNDLRCSDGRIIRKDAFRVQDGHRVPLVWNHQHNTPENTIGHAVLENREEGVYAYCYFNKTASADHARECVAHGDVSSLSIWANNLKQTGLDVLHGVIREVSLVHAGANPGAFIESVLAHNMPLDDEEEEGILYTGESISLSHADDPDSKGQKEEKSRSSEDKTIGDVYETLDSDQKKAVAYIVKEAMKEARNSSGNEEKSDEKKGDDEEMKHNVFENEENDQSTQGTVLSHAECMEILTEARKNGSLRDTIRSYVGDGRLLMHSSIDKTGMEVAKGTQTYGFNDPSMLFPEFRSVNGVTPEWISRNTDWVTEAFSQVHRTPFSRIKSVYADITEDDARARGYIKGKQKKEEVFTTLKRTTSPQTIYKLQKMDRDDVVDITDFDVLAWLRSEMRVMLNEEIARAILIGDGRATDSDDHIREEHVRPIVKDVPLFNTTIKVPVSEEMTEQDRAKLLIDSIIRSRKNYKGSGNPTFWTTEDVLTDMLLVENKIGEKLYKTKAELATALLVSKIVTVEPMAGYELDISSQKYPLIGTIVNLKDYNIGADKGGEINNFEDFDLNFNKHELLIETRISGALVKPFSALTFVYDNTNSPVMLSAPTKEVASSNKSDK